MAAPSRNVLQDELMTLGFSPEDLQSVQSAMEVQKISMLTALEARHKVDPRQLVDVLGPFFGCPVVHLEDRDVQQNIIDLVPKVLAQNFRFIQIDRSANNLIVATGTPQNSDMIKAIQLRTNFFVRTVLASESRVTEALAKYYAATMNMSDLKVDESGFEGGEAQKRKEIGELWENYLVSERVKYLAYQQKWVNNWYWRTTEQQEIDYIEEENGQLSAYEFKWNPKAKGSIPNSFKKTYPTANINIIHRENFEQFLGVQG